MLLGATLLDAAAVTVSSWRIYAHACQHDARAHLLESRLFDLRRLRAFLLNIYALLRSASENPHTHNCIRSCRRDDMRTRTILTCSLVSRARLQIWPQFTSPTLRSAVVLVNPKATSPCALPTCAAPRAAWKGRPEIFSPWPQRSAAAPCPQARPSRAGQRS